MPRIVILGSTGMLGSEVERVAKEQGVEHVAISRNTPVSFDARNDQFTQLAESIGLHENDWLVNCIGWIPQKAVGNVKQDRSDAMLLNAHLPEQISGARDRNDFNWVQIGTDCVFSGGTGSYSESSAKNATDLYGQSKIAGEKNSSGALLIRSSIIGRDQRTHSGIYSWFKSAVAQGMVDGYSNQMWNGVSTTAFARLAIGIAQRGLRSPFQHHWVPRDSVSKYELLNLFARELGLNEDVITAVNTSPALDKTLVTNDPSRNQELWEIAGYISPPSIQALCREFIAIDQKLG